MKKIYLATIIILSAIILFAGNAYAATGSVSLNSDVTQVKEKEEFNIIISANSGDSTAINGLSADIEYDKNILEIVSGPSLIDDTKWADLSELPNLVVLLKTSESETSSADIYKITFKVKEGITAESTTIKLKNIVLSTSSEQEINDIEKTIQINSENTNAGNNGDNGNSGNSGNNGNNGNSGNGEDENYTNDGNKGSELNSSNGSNFGINSNSSSKKTNITANSSNTAQSQTNLPHTGVTLNVIIIALIVVFGIFGIRGYTLLKKYKNI